MRGSGSHLDAVAFVVNEDSTLSLVGIVAAKTKTGYQVDPGKDLFMVMGENADFMSADVSAGKTYYAIVKPRFGWGKARFSLTPVHQDEIDTKEFIDGFNDCRWAATTSRSERWVDANIKAIESRRADYYSDWAGKPEADRPKLLPEDGR